MGNERNALNNLKEHTGLKEAGEGGCGDAYL